MAFLTIPTCHYSYMLIHARPRCLRCTAIYFGHMCQRATISCDVSTYRREFWHCKCRNLCSLIRSCSYMSSFVFAVVLLPLITFTILASPSRSSHIFTSLFFLVAATPHVAKNRSGLHQLLLQHPLTGLSTMSCFCSTLTLPCSLLHVFPFLLLYVRLIPSLRLSVSNFPHFVGTTKVSSYPPQICSSSPIAP